MTENPLAKKLEGLKIILASGSPRRRNFLEMLGIEFEVRSNSVDEIHPDGLKAEEISNYLAELKASSLKPSLKENEVLITSDTVVWHNETSLAKATNKMEAKEMLQKLSGDWHKVITSVCFTTTNGQNTLHSNTEVKFKPLSQKEIEFYIDSYQPFDKAGAYGIQEWLGAIAIEEIQGSYNTVVGFPTHLVYNVLSGFKGLPPFGKTVNV